MKNVLNPTLRDLPYTPSRGQVYKMFCKLPRQTVYAEINATMIRYRSTETKRLTEKDIKNKRTLFHPEWVMILRFLGIPEGYRRPEWLDK